MVERVRPYSRAFTANRSFLETVVSTDTKPPVLHAPPPSETDMLTMYYHCYHHPLFGWNMSNLNIRCDFEKLVSNLRIEQHYNLHSSADYHAAVSLAEEMEPFLWFMVTLVATFESFSIFSPDITTILIFSFSVLHDRCIKLFEDKQQSRVEVFDPQIREVLTELFAGDNSTAESTLNVAKNSTAGKRLVEDIKSWQYIASMSGLVTYLKHRLDHEYINEKTEFHRFLDYQPAVAKAGLVQFILGLAGLRGEAIFRKVHNARSLVAHLELRVEELKYRRVIEDDEEEKLAWAILRVLRAAGIPFFIQEKEQLLVRIHADFPLI